MSKFLFTVLPTDDFGLLTRSLPIARELKLRGHEVAFCHSARGPRIVIAEEGFPNLSPTDPLYYLMSDPTFAGILRLLKKGRAWRTLKVVADSVRKAKKNNSQDFDIEDWLMLRNEEFTRANVNAFIELIDSYQADAIVDFVNLWACIAARIAKRPVITVIQANMHPQGPGLIWWEENPPKMPPISNPNVNKILNQHGMPPARDLFALMAGDSTLVVGMPEVDPIADSADVTYVGAVLWQSPKARLSQAIAGLRKDKPVVWIYTGRLRYAGRKPTQGDSEVVLQASVEALAGEDVQVVLSTGHQDLPKKYAPLPPNFIFEPFVPGLSIAERSDLMIHHGGYGSCQTGLYVGIPQVIIPTAAERESNARRVAQQGAGEMVLPTSGINKKVNVSELTLKVRKVLSTPSYKENAKRVSTKLKEYGGATLAAQLIEKQVS